MATVALPSVGVDPTVPMDWSPLARSRVMMTAFRLHSRVASWLSHEPRVDAWASYAALGLAGLASIALYAAGHF